ncbi:MAG: molybdenum cofactor guanylyltransferase [Acidobacteria bacterium]|nr:molybdenum cofactor guanylyltransferase [Acidobacteriota bacterium]MBV9216372.1 molybdenum cofactor guanylyltransferase [Acidobacteriota bacterium]
MIDINGYVMAGGLSSRMGSPKAAVILGDQTLLDSAIATLTQFTGSLPVIVVRSHSVINFQIPDGLEILEDDATEDDPRAPIFGVRAVLKKCDKEWATILAVDLPFVTAELLNKLSSSRSQGIDAVVATQPDGFPQVLCALYRCEAMILEVENALGRSDISIRGALPEGRTLFVEFGPDQGGVDPLSNLNTPEDVQAAARMLS